MRMIVVVPARRPKLHLKAQSRKVSAGAQNKRGHGLLRRKAPVRQVDEFHGMRLINKTVLEYGPNDEKAVAPGYFFTLGIIAWIIAYGRINGTNTALKQFAHQFIVEVKVVCFNFYCIYKPFAERFVTPFVFAGVVPVQPVGEQRDSTVAKKAEVSYVPMLMPGHRAHPEHSLAITGKNRRNHRRVVPRVVLKIRILKQHNIPSCLGNAAAQGRALTLSTFMYNSRTHYRGCAGGSTVA